VLGFFRKLLGLEPPPPSPWPPPFDCEGEAVQLLATLPPCAQYVVVASDKYSGAYKCEVTVAAAYLAPFMSDRTQWSSGGTRESQVARAALPRWLQNASTTDEKTSYLPPSFVKEIDDWVLNFIRDGIADVYCKECQKSIKNIESATRNQKATGPWREWTAEWRCQSGHLLYTEDHEMRLFPRRS